MGLAPTHKAKLELAKVGYERCDTIKGFLFKLYNDRVDLAKNSLIVVDEAGMVGNDDYSELLRVAAARSCNVILAGDERQLSSMQRGGMFAAYADKFGYFELNEIRRQEVEWGREVALAFSVGSVREGIIAPRGRWDLSPRLPRQGLAVIARGAWLSRETPYVFL
jgi:ATP-dependent exoDNAse (exonuclease V) alpha subunit